MSRTPAKPAPKRNLREECVGAALAIIERNGVEALSLRDVARQLGVSHQAPYKHFPSRDHILAEVVARAFAGFAAHLDARPPGGDAQADLAAMGGAYLAFAAAHPLQYRLMFGTPLPDAAEHPAMMREARHAFSLLRDGLARVAAERGAPATEDALDRDALYVWASMHGMASIRASCAVDTLGLSPDVLASAGRYGLARVSLALSAPVPAQGLPHGAAAPADPNIPAPRRPPNDGARPAPDRPVPARRARIRRPLASDDHG
ncbi:TetR/AcrR family transcriptional regulator [Methylobacterium iners]|uniref:TetR/AcrR family transcriptional regulator n=1 Tax=Methylobacterium iners TaxID=418707 RepID=UPI001EE249F9|nr:TetR/AcrR family transcriptional regulator [Methylobacterium iners]